VKELSWEITQESLEIECFERKLNHGEGLKSEKGQGSI
jgi:hypothetical protein